MAFSLGSDTNKMNRTDKPRGSVFEKDARDHYINSRFDNKRSLLGILI